MSKKAIIFLVFVLSLQGEGWGQTTIFTESIGNSGGTITISTHETNNGFDNDSYTMTQGGSANPADIRVTSASSGYTGASGLSNVFFTSTSGEYGFGIAGISSVGYTTLVLSFGVRKEGASGTAFATLNVEYSTDGSVWNAITVSGYPATSDGAGWYLVSNISVPVGAEEQANLRLRWRKTGTIACRVDDIKLVGTLSCSTPATQALNLIYSNVTATSFDISWTNGDGSTRAVFVKQANTGTAAPVDNTTYTASTIFGSGTQIGSTGWYCVYNSTGTTVSVTGLSGSTDYITHVCEYNCTAGSEKYYTVTATDNPKVQTTICSTPSTQASSITFSNVTSVSMTVNWVRGGTPGEGVIVLAKSGSIVDANPVDGTTYSASSTFGSGTQLGTGNYVVFMGSGTSVNVTGLTPGATYYFKVYEYNCTGADSKFNTSSPPSNSQTTTSCSTPTTQASNITFSAIGSVQMTVSWTNGNGEKRIVKINTVNSFTNPVDGTDPSANNVYGGAGEQVVYNNSGTSVTVTGLTSSTTYWFRVYEATCTGANILFYSPTAANNPNSQATDAETYSACGTEGFAYGTTAPNGWTFTAIGGTYSTSGNYGAASPSLQFDATNDQIVTADVTSPSQLSFWIKGMGTDANCYFKVEGNNGSWVQIDNINPIPTSGTTKTYGSVSGYTKFRFTYTKNNGNVAFDDVQVNCGGCTITTFPFTENFDGVNEPNLPCGWAMTNDNSDNRFWKTSSGYPLSGVNSMYIQKNPSAAMNDWFFTPMLDNLIGASTYNLSFYYRNSISSKTEKLEVKWGTAATAAGMTGGTIYTNASISNEGYLQATGTFSPGSDGDYFIGFHGYSDANQSEIFIDDISIIVCSGAPAAPAAQAATNIDATFFTANWNSVATATKYYLDVATCSGFTGCYVTNYQNKDVGNVTSFTVTGLNTNTTYYYRVRAYNSCGTSGNSGTINLTTLSSGSATYLNQGDLVILAVNANLGSGGSACVAGANNGDEISFMCFKDITTGSSIQILDNGYERNYSGSGQWGNTEGGIILTRTGGTIPAGVVITFRTDINATHDVIFISPDASWSASDLGTYATKNNFNLNNGGDQLYFAQGGTWNGGTKICQTGTCPPSGAGTAYCHNATFPGASGKILFGFSTNGTWTASCSTNPTQNSNLYPLMDCLSMAPTGTTDFNKYTGSLSPATQREWLDRINNTGNWTSYATCALFQAGGPQYDDGMTLTINSGGFSAGTWNGAVDNNWFNCDNWQSLCVPDDTTNVLIPSSGVINESTIGAAGAECHALNIEWGRTLTINNAASSLTLFGPFDNEGTLSHSNGTVTFNGAELQEISGFSPSTFYNLTINNSSDGIEIGDNDITVSNILTLTDGVIATGSYKLIMSGVTSSLLSGGSNASFVYGALRRSITNNTETYSFPVGNGTATTNFHPADFINANLVATSYLDVSVASITEAGNNIDSRLNTSQGEPINNYLESAEWSIVPNAALTGGSFGVKLYVINMGMSASDDNKFCPLKRPDASTDYAQWSTEYSTTSIPASGAVGRIYNSGNGYAQRTGYTSFSKFGIGKGNNPLPIELLFFDAKYNSVTNAVDIEWVTSTEINNDYFTVERAAPPDLPKGEEFNWMAITTVTGAGNSNVELNYKSVDNELPSTPAFGGAGILYYRLKQTDYDGRYEYFGPVTVEIPHTGTISTYPNPVTDEMIISVHSMGDDEAAIIIYDIRGSIVYSGVFTAVETPNLDVSTAITLNANRFPAGIYYITVSNGREKKGMRFVKE